MKDQGKTQERIINELVELRQRDDYHTWSGRAAAHEAMTSDRAYRPAMSVQQALATLREGADRQWDGKVVDVLNRIIWE